MPFHANAVWTVKASSKDTHHSYIVVGLGTMGLVNYLEALLLTCYRVCDDFDADVHMLFSE